MTHPLPSFPPLFPSGEWWRLYLRQRLEGRDDDEAIAIANIDSHIKPREWVRIRLAGYNTVAVPVRGGASALKNRHPESWQLPDEAYRENRKIASTLATLYGSQPFFHLLSYHFVPIPDHERPDIKNVGTMCASAFSRIKKILGLDEVEFISLLAEALKEEESVAVNIGRSLADRFNPSLSIIDSLSMHGRDAIFPLAVPF